MSAAWEGCEQHHDNYAEHTAKSTGQHGIAQSLLGPALAGQGTTVQGGAGSLSCPGAVEQDGGNRTTVGSPHIQAAEHDKPKRRRQPIGQWEQQCHTHHAV